MRMSSPLPPPRGRPASVSRANRRHSGSSAVRACRGMAAAGCAVRVLRHGSSRTRGVDQGDGCARHQRRCCRIPGATSQLLAAKLPGTPPVPCHPHPPPTHLVRHALSQVLLHVRNVLALVVAVAVPAVQVVHAGRYRWASTAGQAGRDSGRAGRCRATPRVHSGSAIPPASQPARRPYHPPVQLAHGAQAQPGEEEAHAAGACGGGRSRARQLSACAGRASRLLLRAATRRQPGLRGHTPHPTASWPRSAPQRTRGVGGVQHLCGHDKAVEQRPVRVLALLLKHLLQNLCTGAAARPAVR